MEGESSLKKYSPELLVQDKSIEKAVRLLPTFYLFHGTNDNSIPSLARSNLFQAPATRFIIWRLHIYSFELKLHIF